MRIHAQSREMSREKRLPSDVFGEGSMLAWNAASRPLKIGRWQFDGGEERPSLTEPQIQQFLSNFETNARTPGTMPGTMLSHLLVEYNEEFVQPSTPETFQDAESIVQNAVNEQVRHARRETSYPAQDGTEGWKSENRMVLLRAHADVELIQRVEASFSFSGQEGKSEDLQLDPPATRPPIRPGSTTVLFENGKRSGTGEVSRGTQDDPVVIDEDGDVQMTDVSNDYEEMKNYLIKLNIQQISCKRKVIHDLLTFHNNLMDIIRRNHEEFCTPALMPEQHFLYDPDGKLRFGRDSDNNIVKYGYYSNGDRCRETVFSNRQHNQPDYPTRLPAMDV